MISVSSPPGCSTNSNYFCSSSLSTPLNSIMEAEKQKLKRDLKKAVANLNDTLDVLGPMNYTPEVVKANKDEWIAKVQNEFAVVREVYLDLEDLFTHEEKQLADETNKALKKAVTEFILSSNTKAMSLHDQPDAAAAANKFDKAAEIGFEIDFQKFNDEIQILSAELEKVDDWGEVSSQMIEVAMRNISTWKKQLQVIKDLFYSMVKVAKTNELDDPEDPNDKLKASEDALESLQVKLARVIEDVEYEDNTRCLYSLVKSKPANVKYPSFSGRFDEDFYKFKKELTDAFEANQIRKEDRCQLLRGCLRPGPKAFIHQDLNDIDEAWSVLKQLYGDAANISMAKRRKLDEMGPLPFSGSSVPTKIKTQLEWLMDLEQTIKDLFKLAEENDECRCEVFRPTTLNLVQMKFPVKDQHKMFEFTGSTKEQFHSTLDYIVGVKNNAKKNLLRNPVEDAGGGAHSSSFADLFPPNQCPMCLLHGLDTADGDDCVCSDADY